MRILITGGLVVSGVEGEGPRRADVLCEGERIVRVSERIEARVSAGEMVIDATGKYVFPGFIDPHVHVYLPFMGTYAKDTWESVSRAAIVGGTTTLMEMICPGKTDDAFEAFELWLGKARGRSACDYSFHMGVTRFDEVTERQLREIVARGVRSFKVFLAYKGALGVDDRELYQALRLAKELGVIVTAHCENETLIDEGQKRLLAEGKTGPEWHGPSRPREVEAEGVHHLMSFARRTGAKVYVVHTSCNEAVAQARAGIEDGVDAKVEVVLPHLLLDKTFAERGDFEGAKYVMSPPLREKGEQEAMWAHLQSGAVSTVGTDHAPFDFKGQKEMGRGDFTKIPNGIPSVEDRVNLLYTHGVCAGRIDLETFVRVASTNAAEIFGLKGKGRIVAGADADVVVYDPEYRGVVSAKTHLMQTDYSAFEGWEIKGRPSAVMVRGKVSARDGRFEGETTWGRIVQRS